MSNNQLIWPLTLFGIVVVTIAGAVLLLYPGDALAAVGSLGVVVTVFVTSLVGLKQVADTKAAVIAVEAQGQRNAEELKAVTIESKVVSQQNAYALEALAQATEKVHVIVNSQRTEMVAQLEANNDRINALEKALDRMLTKTDQQQAVIVEQAATIAAAPSKETE